MTQSTKKNPKWTVACVLYGDFPHLSQRLLFSLYRRSWLGEFNLRIGMNNVCDVTRDIVDSWKSPPHSESLELVIEGDPPFFKYPLMRRLFHDKKIDTPGIMWFDDDSCIKPTAPDDWFDIVWSNTIGSPEGLRTGVWGAPYLMKLQGNQHLYIENQPWYTGKKVRPGERLRFITGGWQVISTDIVNEYDWPPPDFRHNGGDIMLSQLCVQQGFDVGKFTDYVGINCDNSYICSSAKRRGASTAPVGKNFKP